MPPTLIGLAFIDGHRSKRLPHIDYCDLTQPNHNLQGWRIQCLGAQVLFTSPPGWQPGRGVPPDAKEDAPRVTVQIARAHLELYWSHVTDPSELDRATWPTEWKSQPAKEKR